MSQPVMQVMPLGAGQDVGRSCVMVTMGGRSIMFDCGMHVGYRDERRFPDFKLLTPAGRFSDLVTCIIITHFHLDHCGALPYFTEVLGYDGPIYATFPTKVLMPVMLEDYHRVMSERKGDKVWYTRQQIQNCMAKVVAVDLGQRVQVDADFEFTSYYAGHVLGAAMFYAKVGAQSVLYTGDYNTSPDRHLGAAHIERLCPDVLISEATYATTLRDSRRARERDFLQAVHDCVVQGGKVLVPVFAVGRAQELLLLLEEYWDRLGLQVPIYFSGGMASRANLYYRLLINWTNEQVKSPAARHSAFNFPRTQPWDRALLHSPGACVLFATPGMLHGGASLEAFKAWAGSDLNLVILPGYQVGGTLGARLVSNQTGAAGRQVQVDKTIQLEVRCQVRYLSFSAHADAKGILQMVRQCGPPLTVVLVHGERSKMEFMKDKIRRTFNIPCFTPCIGNLLDIRTPIIPTPTPLGKPPVLTGFPARQGQAPGRTVPVRVSEQLLCEGMDAMTVSNAVQRGLGRIERENWLALGSSGLPSRGLPAPQSNVVVSGILIGRKPTQSQTIQDQPGSRAQLQLQLGMHQLMPPAVASMDVSGSQGQPMHGSPQQAPPHRPTWKEKREQKQKHKAGQAAGIQGQEQALAAAPVAAASFLSASEAARALGVSPFRITLHQEVTVPEHVISAACSTNAMTAHHGSTEGTGPGQGQGGGGSPAAKRSRVATATVPAVTPTSPSAAEGAQPESDYHSQCNSEQAVLTALQHLLSAAIGLVGPRVSLDQGCRVLKVRSFEAELQRVDVAGKKVSGNTAAGATACVRGTVEGGTQGAVQQILRQTSHGRHDEAVMSGTLLQHQQTDEGQRQLQPASQGSQLQQQERVNGDDEQGLLAPQQVHVQHLVQPSVHFRPMSGKPLSDPGWQLSCFWRPEDEALAALCLKVLAGQWH